MPLSEQERPRLGIVGLAKAQFQPEAKFDTFATGRGSGALKGAAIGAGEGFLREMSAGSPRSPTN